jgi:hypothetical protein
MTFRRGSLGLIVDPDGFGSWQVFRLDRQIGFRVVVSFPLENISSIIDGREIILSSQDSCGFVVR